MNTYNWTVPNIEAHSCVMRIRYGETALMLFQSVLEEIYALLRELNVQSKCIDIF